jgi:putative alpha-1,2-mannosidase
VKRTVTGAAGATIVVEIPVLDTSVPATPPPVDREVETEGPRERARVRLAYGVGAGGVACAITATALTLIGRSDYRTAAQGAHCASVSGGITCDDTGTRAIHDAQHLANIGTIFAVASGALVAAGAIVYLTAPREKIYVRPQASAQNVGVIIGGSF